MSTLSRHLKKPQTWLLLYGAITFIMVLDSFRAPRNQMTARTYIGAVQLYQHWGRPLLKGRVVCRFSPSCSDYSIEAVERHGIWRGLALTLDRLSRCTHGTPTGTYDPVPPCEDEGE